MAIESVWRANRADSGLWISCKGSPRLEQILLRIAAFLDARLDSPFMLRILQQPGIPQIQKIEAVVRGIETEQAVIILDDFDEIDDEHFKTLLEYANFILRNGCVILTAPVDSLSSKGILLTSLHVPALQDEPATQMLLNQLHKLSSRPLETAQASRLARATHGHPLLIKLTASLLDTISPDVLSRDLERFSGDTIDYITSRSLEGLTPAQLHLLEYLSCFVLPFDIFAVESVHNIPEASSAFITLLRRALIEKSGADRHTVHSIIVSRLAISLPPERRRTHLLAIREYYTQRSKALSIEEHAALIDLHLDLGDTESAKSLIGVYIHGLMSIRLYGLAKDLMSSWLHGEMLRDWGLGHFLQGRLFRISGRYDTACDAFRKAIETGQDAEERMSSMFELANCLALQMRSESAMQEARALYQTMSHSKILIHRAMGIMSLCTTEERSLRAKYIPALEEAAEAVRRERIAILDLKLDAVLGEALLEDTVRRTEGLELIKLSVKAMLEHEEKGQFGLALRHYLTVLRDEHEHDKDYVSAAKTASQLIGVLRWFEDVERLASELYHGGVAHCLVKDYIQASRMLRECLGYCLKEDFSNREHQSHVSAWLAVSMWHSGAKKPSVACQVFHVYICGELDITPKPFIFVEQRDVLLEKDFLDIYTRQFVFDMSSTEDVGEMMRWRSEYWEMVDSGSFNLLNELEHNPIQDEVNQPQSPSALPTVAGSEQL